MRDDSRLDAGRGALSDDRHRRRYLLAVGDGGLPEVLATATAYARWRLLGIISMATTMAVKSFFDGIGKTYVHLVAALIMKLA